MVEMLALSLPHDRAVPVLLQEALKVPDAAVAEGFCPIEIPKMKVIHLCVNTSTPARSLQISVQLRCWHKAQRYPGCLAVPLPNSEPEWILPEQKIPKTPTMGASPTTNSQRLGAHDADVPGAAALRGPIIADAQAAPQQLSQEGREGLQRYTLLELEEERAGLQHLPCASFPSDPSSGCGCSHPSLWLRDIRLIGTGSTVPRPRCRQHLSDTLFLELLCPQTLLGPCT